LHGILHTIPLMLAAHGVDGSFLDERTTDSPASSQIARSPAALLSRS
jgi:hypothetical protein